MANGLKVERDPRIKMIKKRLCVECVMAVFFGAKPGIRPGTPSRRELNVKPAPGASLFVPVPSRGASAEDTQPGLGSNQG